MRRGVKRQQRVSALGRWEPAGGAAEGRGDFWGRVPTSSLRRSMAVASSTVGAGAGDHGVQPHKQVTAERIA